MQFPESWLREWVDPDIGTDELAERLTLAGHEVEAVLPYGEGLDGPVVVEVLTVGRHPDADSLSVCRVTDGGAQVEVVCGAPNVAAGMKAVLARPGDRLPDGTKLRRRKIRGVSSEGMLCSARELGLGEEADGILRLQDAAAAGTPLASLLGLPDRLLEIKLTPNRGDCFSIRGIAREVAAITGSPLEERSDDMVAASVDDRHAVIVEDTAACPRFAGRVVRGVDPAAVTPAWMVERLRRCGLRPIHPVVDVTNYVMLESGQPMHAYDLGQLRGPIRPRFAKPGEKVALLDEREVELTADTLIISDDSGAIGLAGIMGGLGTAVGDATVDVFFEAAFWPPAVVAGRARAYGLHTDASQRFERGVDPAGQARAVERATALLIAIAGGRPGPLEDLRDEARMPRSATIELPRRRLDRVLGVQLPDEDVSAILRRLSPEVSRMAESWCVRVPSYRFDLAIADDLVEEIARIHGYDRIAEITATAPLPLPASTETRVDTERLAATLVARDYFEVVTYSFIDAGLDRLFTGRESGLALSNPISSDMAVMRGSLWPGMLQAAAANLARQTDRVRLFEIGTTFHGTLQAPGELRRLAATAIGPRYPEQWGTRAEAVDFFDIKSDVEALLRLTGDASRVEFEAHAHPALQPGQAARILRQGDPVGVVGKLHPSLASQLDISRDVLLFELDLERGFAAQVPAAASLSRYPAVRRDLAVVVDEGVPAAALVEVVLSAAPDIIREAVIFDVYHGPGIEAGRKSVALGLILQETSRTLTDHDADIATSAAVRGLQQKFAAVLRD